MKTIITLCLIFLFASLNYFAQTSATPTPVPADVKRESLSTAPQTSPAEEQQTALTKSSAPESLYVKKDAPVRIPRFEAPPVIDGKLDDAVWRSAAVFGDFLQISPGDNVKPTHPTEVRIGYDSKNLYIS